ncbi:MAG: carboxypeptidase-like regulatory domain-containing protein, partial [bacterium]
MMKTPRSLRIIILGFTILLPCMLAAQSEAVDKEIAGVISGQVYDAETKQPLAAVNVFVDSLLVGTATTNDGKFVLSYLQ